MKTLHKIHHWNSLPATITCTSSPANKIKKHPIAERTFRLSIPRRFGVGEGTTFCLNSLNLFRISSTNINWSGLSPEQIIDVAVHSANRGIPSPEAVSELFPEFLPPLSQDVVVPYLNTPSLASSSVKESIEYFIELTAADIEYLGLDPALPIKHSSLSESSYSISPQSHLQFDLSEFYQETILFLLKRSASSGKSVDAVLVDLMEDLIKENN